MCGRSRQMVQPQALASAVGFDSNVSLRRANDYRRRENAHPGNSTPIAYRTTRGDEALRSMRWGLVPSFTRQGDKPEFFRMFNARSETAAEKPSFRRLVGRRHGVVAFSGFYEWKKDEMGERQPYYFHFQDDRPILLAVLYDTWRQGDDGRSSSSNVKVCEQEATASKQLEHCKQKKEEEDEWDKEDDRGNLMFSYAVLTTSAAPRVAWLHERMPIILRGAEDAELWLRVEGSQQASAFLESHTPYNGSDLVWHPVSKKMNSMRYDGEDCSAAVELKPQKPLPAITTFFKKKSRSPPRSPSSSSGAADVKAETRWTKNGKAVGSDLQRNDQASSASATTTTTTKNSRWEAGAVQGTLDRECKGVGSEAGSLVVPKRIRYDTAELVDLADNDDCTLSVAVSSQPLPPPSFGLKHPRMWKGRQEDVTTPTRQAESERGQRPPTQATPNPKKPRRGKSGGDGSGKRSPGNGGWSPGRRDKNQPNLMSFFQPNG